MNWELGMKFMPRAIRISEIWQRWSSGGRPAHPVSAVCVCVCVEIHLFWEFGATEAVHSSADDQGAEKGGGVKRERAQGGP